MTRSQRRSLLVVLPILGMLLPATAHAANIEVAGQTLKVSVPPAVGSGTNIGQSNAAAVQPIDGGAIVGLYGSLPAVTAGNACQQVASSSLGSNGVFSGLGAPTFVATCNLTGVRTIEGRLTDIVRGQGWASNVNLPTTVISTPGVAPSGPQGDLIVTGPAGDTITGSDGDDVIDAGGAPYKGQEALPPIGTPSLDDADENRIDGRAGNDTFRLDGQFSGGATGRDVVTGGAGTDRATYELRFGIGAPGTIGVNVTLDDVRNDGDPAIDPTDSAVMGEADNVKSDVENVTGTKREDSLTGTSGANLLDGREGKDTLSGLAGVDRVMAREPGGVGLKDTISCGSPTPFTTIAKFGFVSPKTISTTTTIEGDTLNADLLDGAPADCETLEQGPVKEGPNVVVARKASRGGASALRVGLSCPKDAGRTCSGKIGVAARSGAKGPTSSFSVKRGKRATATVPLSAAVTKGIAGKRAILRLVSTERGRFGAVNTVAYADVPKG